MNYISSHFRNGASVRAPGIRIYSKWHSFDALVARVALIYVENQLKTTGIHNSAIKIVARSCINYVDNFVEHFSLRFFCSCLFDDVIPFARISFALKLHFITFERISNAITQHCYGGRRRNGCCFGLRIFLLLSCGLVSALYLSAKSFVAGAIYFASFSFCPLYHSSVRLLAARCAFHNNAKIVKIQATRKFMRRKKQICGAKWRIKTTSHYVI